MELRRSDGVSRAQAFAPRFLMDYGYEDEVLFPLKLRVADSVKAGPGYLRAAVDWLVCRDSCIPGSAELELQRNVDPDRTKLPMTGPTLQAIYNRLPKPLPAGAKAVFQPAKDGFRLTVETGQRELSAMFFPEDQDIIDNPARRS